MRQSCWVGGFLEVSSWHSLFTLYWEKDLALVLHCRTLVVEPMSFLIYLSFPLLLNHIKFWIMGFLKSWNTPHPTNLVLYPLFRNDHSQTGPFKERCVLYLFYILGRFQLLIIIITLVLLWFYFKWAIWTCVVFIYIIRLKHRQLKSFQMKVLVISRFQRLRVVCL